MIRQLKNWAHIAKRDVMALYLAARDPRVPWYLKALAAMVAGYALSPIDLIPDFIPIVGYLDDLIILPLGIVLVVRMMPKAIMDDLRRRAEVMLVERPRSNTAAIVVICIWFICVVTLSWMMWGD